MLGEQVLDEGEAPSQQLEPADGGKAAWRLLCTAFIVEALLWGKDAHCKHFSSS